MQNENFNFEKLTEMFDKIKPVGNGKKQFRPISDEVKSYVNKYFYTTTQGGFYFWNASKKTFEPHTNDSIKTVFTKRFPEEVANWFFKDNYDIFNVVVEVNKPCKRAVD